MLSSASTLIWPPVEESLPCSVHPYIWRGNEGDCGDDTRAEGGHMPSTHQTDAQGLLWRSGRHHTTPPSPVECGDLHR